MSQGGCGFRLHRVPSCKKRRDEPSAVYFSEDIWVSFRYCLMTTTIGSSFKADLHVHSDYSEDSRSKVGQIVRRAFELGLDLVAITDHFVDKAFHDLKAKPALFLDKSFIVEVQDRFVLVANEHRKLIIVKGKEASTREDYHVIALAYAGQVRNFRCLEETLREIEQNGGISIIPHPCNTASHGVGIRNLRHLIELRDPLCFDAI